MVMFYTEENKDDIGIISLFLYSEENKYYIRIKIQLQQPRP